MKLIFLFVLCLAFFPLVSFSEEIRVYDCSAVSVDQSGSLNLVLAGDIESRGYFVKYSKGKISEIGGIIVNGSAIQKYMDLAQKKDSEQNKIHQFGFIGSYGGYGGYGMMNQNTFFNQVGQFMITTLGYKVQTNAFGIGSKTGSSGAGLGMYPGIGTATHAASALDTHPSRPRRETRPGALIPIRAEGVAHSSEQSKGQENEYTETRPGALIRPRGEAQLQEETNGSRQSQAEEQKMGMAMANHLNEVSFSKKDVPKTDAAPYVETRAGALIQPREGPSAPALGQLIGIEGVTTFTAVLNPFEEISKLSYREGIESQVSLPSQYPVNDRNNSKLKTLKDDMDKIKQLTRCCISGSNRSCEGKNVVRAEDMVKARAPKNANGAVKTAPSR